MRRLVLPERPDWRDKARAVGFGFHEMYGEPYWFEGAAYAFSLAQIEDDIEAPSEALHALCLALVADVVEDEAQLRRLSIPEAHFDLIRASWRAGDRHLYGRFDLAYDGSGPAKLLEYNADTPTAIFEAAFFQHNWLIDQIDAGALPDGTDQFNLLQESLVEAFAAFPPDRIFHFACWTGNEEDRGTCAYLMDCAVQAGHAVDLVDIRTIGVDPQGRFTDRQDRTFVIDEYVQSGKTIEQHAAEIRSRDAKRGRARRISCDPAGNSPNEQTAESNISYLRRNGFTVKTRGSRIQEGLELIRARLRPGHGPARLFVNERCTRLIKALQAYHYPPGGGEVPVKDGEHDHLIDALRYHSVNHRVQEMKSVGY